MAHQVLSFTFCCMRGPRKFLINQWEFGTSMTWKMLPNQKRGYYRDTMENHLVKTIDFIKCVILPAKKHIWSAKMVIWPSKHCDFTWFYNQKIEIQLGHIGNHWCMNSRMCILKDKWTLGTWIPEPTQQQFIFGFGGCFPHMRSKPRLRNGEASDKLLYRAHSWSL